MNLSLPYLLLAGGVLLVLMCVSALAVMREQQRRGRFEARVVQQASSYGRAVAPLAPQDKRTTPTATHGQAILRFCSRLVAFDPSHQERYPLAWWIVLPGALALAWALAAVAQIIVGKPALLLLPVMWVADRSPLLPRL